MTTTQDTPRTIRATIDDSVLERITSFFDAGLEDIIKEMLQNARRSGATAVHVTQSGGIITVQDDGCGIADPQALLSFGRSDWTDEKVKDEHPAGMGIYALSRANTVTIQSKIAGEPAWWVDLIPQHFIGREEAHVVSTIHYDPPAGHGTSISFPWIDDGESCVMRTSRYFPLPVFFNGREMERHDFLHDAIYVREWEGLRFGVYRDGYGRRNMNFHGIVVDNREIMVSIPTLVPHKHYQVSIDVVDCPNLELTLPARKEVVKTPYLDRVRRAAVESVYLHIAGSDQPEGMPKSVQDDAALLFGIAIPDPPARLPVWEPRSYRDDRRLGEDRDVRDATAECLLLEDYFDWPGQQTLARALANQPNPPVILEGDDRKLRGYGWYDRLDRVNEMTVGLTLEGETCTYEELMDPSEREFPDGRPEAITVTLEVIRQDGTRYELPLNSDVALPDEQTTYSGDVSPVVSAGSTINPGDLADMLMDGYFQPSDDYESDSHQTQEYDAEQNFVRICQSLLMSGEEAIRQAIHNDIRYSSMYQMKVGTVVTITVGKEVPLDIQVQLPETD